jgi:hypothetical protein
MQQSPFITITFGKHLENLWRTFGEHRRTFGEHLENTREYLENTEEHWGTCWEHLETVRPLMQRSEAPLDHQASVAQQNSLTHEVVALVLSPAIDIRPVCKATRRSTSCCSRGRFGGRPSIIQRTWMQWESHYCWATNRATTMNETRHRCQQHMIYTCTGQCPAKMESC